MLSRCFLDCSVGVRVFVTGLSQISCFFSQNVESYMEFPQKVSDKPNGIFMS